MDEPRRAGDDASALGWLWTSTPAGGSDGSMAWVQLAEIHFDAGRVGLVMAELDATKVSLEREHDVYAMQRAARRAW